MDFVIAIRSHKRAEMLESHTYAILKRNNLEDNAYIFVNEEQVEEYGRFPRVIGVQSKCAKEKFQRMTEHFPIGQRIVFMDDDLIDFYHFNSLTKPTRKSTRLRALIEDGFDLVDRYNLGSFSCSMNSKGATINPLYIRGKPEREFTFRFLQACFFGCRNDPALINTLSDQDDVERTAAYFERYKGILFYWRAGFKNDFGSGSGGSSEAAMRTQATRLEETKRTSEELFTRMPSVFVGTKYNKAYHWFDLKFKNSRVLRKQLEAPRVELPVSSLFETP